MSTPSSRAGFLRGGLVGGCSALVTALAHTAGGGEIPVGSTLVALIMVCATVGAGVSTMDVAGRHLRVALLVAALSAGQGLGHLTLAAVGHHHSGGLFTTPMLVVHAVAAVVLGLLIGAVDYLYVVCCSVLSWLRLFATAVHSPAVASVRRRLNVVVVQSVLLRAGLGMRAPPAPSALGA